MTHAAGVSRDRGKQRDGSHGIRLAWSARPGRRSPTLKPIPAMRPLPVPALAEAGLKARRSCSFPPTVPVPAAFNSTSRTHEASSTLPRWSTARVPGSASSEESQAPPAISGSMSMQARSSISTPTGPGPRLPTPIQSPARLRLACTGQSAASRHNGTVAGSMRRPAPPAGRCQNKGHMVILITLALHAQISGDIEKKSMFRARATCNPERPPMQAPTAANAALATARPGRRPGGYRGRPWDSFDAAPMRPLSNINEPSCFDRTLPDANEKAGERELTGFHLHRVLVRPESAMCRNP